MQDVSFSKDYYTPPDPPSQITITLAKQRPMYNKKLFLIKLQHKAAKKRRRFGWIFNINFKDLNLCHKLKILKLFQYVDLATSSIV